MIKVGKLFDRALKCVQVQISSSSTPALELENKWEASGSWEDDWEALVSKALQVFASQILTSQLEFVEWVGEPDFSHEPPNKFCP